MDLFTPPPFRCADYAIRFAREPWEMAGAQALRRDVFCREQRLFDDDADALDAAATVLVAVSNMAGNPDDIVGTVRIHEVERGVWWGSRLAVAATHRRIGALGPALIKLAVSSAHARGCTSFFAHVQAQNELMFRRLAWRRRTNVALHGRPHVLMQADLAAYPPIHDGHRGFTTWMERAA